MASSLLGVSPLLKPNPDLDHKWLAREPMKILDDDILYLFYNELLADKEIYRPPKIFLNRNSHTTHKSANGKFYCGENQLLCKCCTKVCGPLHGCNCDACLEIETAIKGGKDPWKLFTPSATFESWAWGSNPNLTELKVFSMHVAHQQLNLLGQSLEMCTPVKKLKTKVLVYSRFLSVLSRCLPVIIKEKKSKENKENESLSSKSENNGKVTTKESFINSGINLVMNTLMKYLEKTWIDGTYLDICFDLVNDAVSMLRDIDQPLLFDASRDTNHLFVAEEMVKLLGNIVEASTCERNLHFECREKLLVGLLLFEIGFQSGSPFGLLHAIVVSLNLIKDGVIIPTIIQPVLRKFLNQSMDTTYVREIVIRFCDDEICAMSALDERAFVENHGNDLLLVITQFMNAYQTMMQPYKFHQNKVPNEHFCDNFLVWGNLKLLSSLREEKNLCVKIASIVCTELFFLVLALDGGLYYCESELEVLNLKPYKEVNHLQIVHLDCSFDGHFIALTKQREVYTWTHKSSFWGLVKVSVQCQDDVECLFAGYSNYAVLSKSAELCIWDNQPINSSNNDKTHHPVVFDEFEDSKIVDIALSQFLSEVIIVTEGGKIWSWHNSSVTLLAQESIDISKVYIAKYFYIVLSTVGQVWRWGKDRFNKKSMNDKICLQSVEKLSKENVLSISVGAYHCIALTKTYSVYSWGGLGGKEEDESLIREPILLGTVSSLGVNRIKAGPHQVFCWSLSLNKKMAKRVPFCIDIKEETFQVLTSLLRVARTIECHEPIVSSALALLKLQFDAAKECNIFPAEILLNSQESRNLKDLLVDLSTNESYGNAAKEVLQSGWMYLFPTARIQAQTITDLLKDPLEKRNMFLLCILLNGLMLHNGIEILLEDTIVLMTNGNDGTSFEKDILYEFLTRLFLVKTYDTFKEHADVTADVMAFLLKFQRLLFAKVFQLDKNDVCWPSRCYAYELPNSIKSLSSILSFYLTQLQASCKQILLSQQQSSIDLENLLMSPAGVLFHEFLVYMIILQNYSPAISSSCDGMSQLADLLDAYHAFNNCIFKQERFRAKNDWCFFGGNNKNNKETAKEIHNQTTNRCADVSSVEKFAEHEVSMALVVISTELKTLNKGKNMVLKLDRSSIQSIFVENETLISFLIGLHCAFLAHGLFPINDELVNEYWITSELFSAGLNRDSLLKKSQPLKETAFHQLLQEHCSSEYNLLMEHLIEHCNVPVIPIASEMLEYLSRSLLAAMAWHCGLEEELMMLTVCVATNSPPLKLSLSLKTIVRHVLKYRLKIVMRHQELGQPYPDICMPLIRRCQFLCLNLDSCSTTKSKKTSKWLQAAWALKGKFGYSWDIFKWSGSYKEVSWGESQEKILKDICQFIEEEQANLDVLRKCFLVQTKRAKQRLIAGYLMQSLSIRQHLEPPVHLALLLGWLGVVFRSGLVSNVKPDIYSHVELVPKDDIAKLLEVFKGLENFITKNLLTNLEKISKMQIANTDAKDLDFRDPSWSFVLVGITTLSSSLMSGEVSLLIQCDILEKIQRVLVQFKKNSLKSSSPEIKQDDGKTIVESMKVGCRVVRGPDWKWDEQDGGPHGVGCVISPAENDGWVRVQWQSGVRNLYRMGKGGKYDLQLATVDKKDDEKSNDPVSMTKECLTGMLLCILSKAAVRQNKLSTHCICPIANFVIELLKEVVEQDSFSLGESIPPYTLFGFIRALCISDQIKELLSREEFVDLLIRMLELVFATSASPGALRAKEFVQMLKQIKYLIGASELVTYTPTWRVFPVKSFFNMLQKLLLMETLYKNDHDLGSKISLLATPRTNMAQELIATLCYLHNITPWKDIINYQIQKSLVGLRENRSLYNFCANDQSMLLASLCVMVGCEDRVCIGGFVETSAKEMLSVGSILPSKNVALYPRNSRVFVETSLADIQAVPELSCDWKSMIGMGNTWLETILMWFLSEGSFLQDFKHLSDARGKNAVRLHVLLMRILSQVDYMKHFQLNKTVLCSLMQKALQSTPIQTTYEHHELQLAALALCESQEQPDSIDTKSFLKEANEPSTNCNSPKAGGSEVTCLPTTSQNLINQLKGMGFPMESILSGFRQLGTDTRPELLVAWLLEQPSIREQKDTEDCDNPPKFEVAKKIQVGTTVKCLQDMGDIRKDDIGTVNKVLSLSSNALVHWERFDRILWIPVKKIVAIDPDKTQALEPTTVVCKYIIDLSLSTALLPFVDSFNMAYTKHTSKNARFRLTLQPSYVIIDLSLIVSCTHFVDNSIKFIVNAGDSIANLKFISEVFVRPAQAEVKILEKQQVCYEVIEVELIAKSCHDINIYGLNLNAKELDSSYDHQIIELFCSQEQENALITDKDEECSTLWEGCTNKQVAVFSWGLNDKDQLGGLKGSKIKYPIESAHLSALQCKYIAGGSKTTFFITTKGKLHACGESSYGKLGLGDVSGNVTNPRIVGTLGELIVTKVAVHSCGNHVLALTDNGMVFSWGDGEDGKLGHGSTVSYNKPQLVEAFLSKVVTDIACGSAHSASIVNNKYLYTWGLGDFGRLGHGDEETLFVPKQVKHFVDCNVIQVACGSRDAQTVCITDDDRVWSWGDGDFGKLGRGGSERCLVPTEVESLRGLGVCKVLCGAQFTVALTKSGNVWSWGKGDYYRLGHGEENHVREPKLISGLLGVKILDIAIGALHCLAVTEIGQVYSWGDNDHGQQGSCDTISKKLPTLVAGTRQHHIKYVACGSSHSIVWTEITSTACIIKEPVLFRMNYDPLGTSFLHTNDSDNTLVIGLTNFLKEHRPSLMRSVMQISCLTLREESLQKILQTLETLFARDCLCAWLKTCDDSCLGALVSAGTVLQSEAYMLDVVNLYKLGLFGHLSQKNTKIIEEFIKNICIKNNEISEKLLNICIKELEAKNRRSIAIQEKYKPVVQESAHPYHSAPGAVLSSSVKYHGVSCLIVEFDPMCQMEANHDVLMIYDGKGKMVAAKTGDLSDYWNYKLKVAGDELHWSFTANSLGGQWGFRFTVTPAIPMFDTDLDCLSDDAVLRIPCLEMVKRLLEFGVTKKISNEMTILKVISALCRCITLTVVNIEEKMWMFSQLHALLLSHNAPPVNVAAIFNGNLSQNSSLCKLRTNGNQEIIDAVLRSPLSEFIAGIPHALLDQYRFEEMKLQQGDQLMFSPFLRTLVLFACSLGLDSLTCCSDKQKWAWFTRYCLAIRTAHSFIQNTPLPKEFALETREKLMEILDAGEQPSFEYERHDMFSKKEDRQLLTWVNRKSQDWDVLWGGSGTVYGWGHNHCGQLGGVGGNKVKTPILTSTIAATKPVQIAGGEQSLFLVNSEGKVYAAGYGNGGRLGLGYTDTILSPRLLESIKHINIKKVVVHSGGKHCLALSSDGEVFTWGEGDDGKLGHGNRLSFHQPKRVESFYGKVIIDVAAGGSHSAAISESGELYTWGKGRYGRLGHGDGEDQLKPKIVETLRSFFVIDVACGSGDAQTLCVTNNGSVWSWGDGDYGKLGRGGSDGCKIPELINCLSDKQVVQVKCGSQFSMALTKLGALYTWGKGDFHRLGHGSVEHVRRPMQVLSLANKVVRSISCGTLHCVVCTDNGEVYCWGDNDEGQLGDGTTVSREVPKMIESLQHKKIDRISCGSAHTIAWSTNRTHLKRSLPQSVPVEYNHLQHIPISVLRDRAFLLYRFSKLFCSCLPWMDLVHRDNSTTEELMVNSLRRVILFTFKESGLRKIIDSTTARDQQHGPVVQLNRVKKHRLQSRDVSLSDINQSLFVQLSTKICNFPLESFCLANRTWKVKFIGESVDDVGGGFSESIAEMCEELQSGMLKLLLPTPNNLEDNDVHYDCFLFNPNHSHPNSKDMFYFLGILLGVAIRSGHPLSLSLAEPMWKLLAGLNINLEDISEMDRGFSAKYSYMLSKKLSEEEYPYTVLNASGGEIRLSAQHDYVTEENKMEYLRSALHFKQHEYDNIVAWMRYGMARVIPVPLLSLFTGSELEGLVCGKPEISVEEIRSLTSYKGVEPCSPLVGWFWRVLEGFTNHERSLFLRFVWGRTRLPRTHEDFRGRDFIFQVLDKYNPPDDYLPESYTCFFLLKMPRYTNFNVLKQKLTYAIYFCKSIDSDDYARIESVTG